MKAAAREEAGTVPLCGAHCERQGPLDSTPKSDAAVERAVRARESAADRPLSDGDYSRCKDNLR